MELEKRVDDGEQPEVKTGSEATSGRRRFMCGAGAIVPVVLTVGSRSALATTCLSPSASASINLLHSRQDRADDGRCAGRSPGYWKNHVSQISGQLFNGIFPGESAYADKTMKQVVAVGGNQNYAELARHLAAAWCNLISGKVAQTVLSLSDLQAMWTARSIGYSPTPGVTWSDAQMADYLKTTMI